MDDSFLLLLHAGDDGIDFTLPGVPWAAGYEVVIDTGQRSGIPDASPAPGAGKPMTLEPRTVVLLRVTTR
jgi:glycogen operon protein